MEIGEKRSARLIAIPDKDEAGFRFGRVFARHGGIKTDNE